MLEETLFSAEALIADQLHFLKSPQDSWQPSDFLPDSSKDNWQDEVAELRKRALSLPDDVLVVLVGNLVTEEALPSYQTWLNRPEGMQDETGASQSSWAIWTRGWTAEENRHGDLLNRYLYLSGRVNNRSVEVTVQYLIRNGFDLKSGKDPYRALAYAAFQERATKISHANTGKLAQQCGEALLSKICGVIAADEARHEEAYKRIFAGLLEIQPERALIALADMMRRKIAMPARLMSDGTEQDVFANFAVVAQRTGMYTINDYAEIIDHLVSYWKIGSYSVAGEAAEAQEYLCSLSKEYYRKADRIQETVKNLPKESFSWIFGREA